jgi:hypothetical protein
LRWIFLCITAQINLLEYDDVSNDQRKIVYKLRDELMDANNVQDRFIAIRQGVACTLALDFSVHNRANLHFGANNPSLPNVLSKNDHIIFNVGTPSLEARNIRLVNIITYIIEESKLISENMSPNVIHKNFAEINNNF